MKCHSRQSLVPLLFLCLLQTIDSFVCQDDFDCAPHGTCGNDLLCHCSSTHTGEQCEYPCGIDCQNGATCVMMNTHGAFVEGNDFRCECAAGYSGALCQVRSDNTFGSGLTSSSSNNNNQADGRTIGIILGTVIVLGGVALYVMMRRRQHRSAKNVQESIESSSSAEIIAKNETIPDEDKKIPPLA